MAILINKRAFLSNTLTLSRAIAESKASYYRAFKDAENPLNHGELTHFVICIMEYISASQDRLITDPGEKTAQTHDVLKVVDELELSEKDRSILFMLAQLELFAAFPNAFLDEIAGHLKVSRQTARSCMKRLESEGLVRATSKRPLRFALSQKGLELLGL